jgi:hypothetical protein
MRLRFVAVIPGGMGPLSRFALKSLFWCWNNIDETSAGIRHAQQSDSKEVACVDHRLLLSSSYVQNL